MINALYYGILKDKYDSTTIQGLVPEKSLMPAVCSKCGKKGMAYMNPSLTVIKPHLCIKCNPKIRS